MDICCLILELNVLMEALKVSLVHIGFDKHRTADKSLARPGRKQAASVKSVMGRGMD